MAVDDLDGPRMASPGGLRAFPDLPGLRCPSFQSGYLPVDGQHCSFVQTLARHDEVND
jgi:hypothetical protein